MIDSITLSLPKKWYCSKTWNCFHLANWCRQQSKLKQFTKKFLKASITDNPNECLEYYLKTYGLEISSNNLDFDLFLLEFDNTKGLGTLIKNDLIYMGNTQATHQPLERLEPYIIKVYRY